MVGVMSLEALHRLCMQTYLWSLLFHLIEKFVVRSFFTTGEKDLQDSVTMSLGENLQTLGLFLRTGFGFFFD